MTSIDDAVVRTEEKERIRGESRARLGAYLASKNKGQEPVISTESEPPVVLPIPVDSAKPEPKEPFFDGEITENEIERGDFQKAERGVPNTESVPTITREEKDGLLVELSQKLEDARKFYVEQDREMDKGSSVWKKIFGFGKRLESGTLKESFENSKLAYEDALISYKGAILASEVGDNEDARIVAEWITKGEFLNLERERLDGKAREEKGWPSKIANGYLGMVDKYRKLSTAKKIAIGLGITAAGFGIGLTGGTVLAGGLLTSRQIFSMSVSSVGFKAMFEGIAKKRREGEGDKAAENILENSHTEGWEDVHIDLLSQNLDHNIGELDLRFQKEKKDEKFRTWAAIGSGVALSYIARYFGKEAMEHSGAGKVMKSAGGKIFDVLGKGHMSGIVNETVSAHHPGEQVFPHGEMADEQSVLGVKGPISEKVPGFSDGDAHKFVEGLKQEEALKAKIAAEDLVKSASEIKEVPPLVVKPGSSLEGTIIQHLKDQGMSPDEAGKKAHRMALEFLNNDQSATEHHLIHPDAKIVLDASGEKIMSVDDSGHITMAPPDKSVPGPDWEKLVEKQEGYLKVDEAVSSDFPGAESAVAPAVEAGDFLDEKAGILLENTNADLAMWQAVPEGGVNMENYATLGANFTKSLAKLIGGNHFEDWASIKGLSVKEVVDGDSEGGKRISALLSRLAKAKLPEADEDTIKQFQKMLKPKGGERVYDWMKRVALLVKHFGIKKI